MGKKVDNFQRNTQSARFFRMRLISVPEKLTSQMHPTDTIIYLVEYMQEGIRCCYVASCYLNIHAVFILHHKLAT